jgi:predicted transcriptional regulator
VKNNKTLNSPLRLDVTAEMKAELERLAERDDRSIAAVARRLIREGLERERATA